MLALSIRNIVFRALKDHAPTNISQYGRGWPSHFDFMVYEIYVTLSKRKLIDNLSHALQDVNIPLTEKTKEYVSWKTDENLVDAVLTSGSTRKGIWRISCIGTRKPIPPMSSFEDEQ